MRRATEERAAPVALTARGTYEPGPSWRSATAVTTRTIVRLVDELHLLFDEGWSFVPEPISEGGILVAEWPGREEGQYKAMRVRLGSRGSGRWPWIKDSTLQEWRDGEERVIWSPTRPGGHEHPRAGQDVPCVEGTTFAKALYGAPAWSELEVERFALAMERAGMAPRRQRRRKTAKG